MRHVSLHGLLAPFAACLLLMCGAAEAHAQPPVAVFVREAPTMGAQGMSFRVDLHPMAAANGSDVHVEVVFAHAPAAPMPAPGRTAAVEAGALPAALPPAAAMEVLPAGAGDPGGARLRVLARHDAAAAPPADAARAAGGEAAVAFFVVASACAAPAPPAAPAAAAEAGLRCGGPTSSTPRGGGPQPEVQHATPEQALPAPPEARVLLTRQEAGAGTWSMRADHPLRLVGPLSLAFQLPPETLLQGQEASGPILLRLSGPAFEAPLVVPLQTVGGAESRR
ncbi:MAG TPA: hypothetical protein VFH47_08245, partial [Candidatus Thermoplasmatota archaeon]|nr:hypothetical protein [Candidatus Thermoplasmatota archaeon]